MKKGEKRLIILNRLKLYRLKYKLPDGKTLTAAALGRAVGMSKWAIIGLEARVSAATQVHAQALADFFGCKISDLFYIPDNSVDQE